MKGMTVRVLSTPDYRGCAAGGVTESHDEVTLLPSEDFPNVPALFAPTDKAPAVVIVKRSINDRSGNPYLTAYAVDSETGEIKRGMMGGAFIYSSDSRFRVVSDYPVPVHDRIER